VTGDKSFPGVYLAASTFITLLCLLAIRRFVRLEQALV
jgi:hypothetical protein